MRSSLPFFLALAFGAAAVPLACGIPSYIYDVPPSTGGGSTTHPTSSGSTASMSTGTGADTSSSSGGTGGTMTTTTSSTIPSCSQRDCSNPACMTTFSCYPAIPTGWMGYFELYDNTATSPGCGGEFPDSKLLGNDGIQVPDATCTCKACTATGQVCSPGGMPDSMMSGTTDEIIVIDAACGGTITCGGALEVPNNWNGACYGADGFYGGSQGMHCGPSSSGCTGAGTACNVAVQAAQLKLTGGTCGAPPTVMKTFPPVTWTNNAEVCGGPMAGTGCNSGHTCLPKPQGAYVTGVCIMQTGDQPCPAGFLDKHVIYDPTKTVEGRTCGACTCGAMSGGSCSATIEVYGDSTVTTCNTLLATLHPSTSQGDCQPLSGNPNVGSRQATFGPVTAGTCAAGGGTPGGTATPGGPTTICCSQ